MTSKKYQSNIEQIDNTWTARITRQISSQKTHVSKQQEGFKTEDEAKQWADKRLIEFAGIQQSTNKRQNTQRKESDEAKQLNAQRHAEKSAAIKAAKKEARELKQQAFEEGVPVKMPENNFEGFD